MEDDLRRDKWLLPVLGRFVIIASLAVSIVDIDLLQDRRFILPMGVDAFGFILLVAGISLDIIGRLTLRKFYSESVRIRPDHKLITYGIYRFIQHPIYLGVVLYAFSLPLVIRSLLGVIVTVALIPMIVRRIKLEEKLLATKFGQEYAAYARRTKKLIPHLY